MNFNLFLNAISMISEVELTAVSSHIKMAPLERIDSMEKILDYSDSARKAAVMMLFYPKAEVTHLVLIVRNTYPGVHSSQIAFPGGKVEESDLNFQEAALRETFEEIGVSPNKIIVVKSFSSIYIPPSNFLVVPFMGICTTELDFVLQQEEVSDIVELPLKMLLDDSIITSKTMVTSYAKAINVPVFQIYEHAVWGATAMMLSELKDVLKKVL
ncbi:NUDIX hydrolase [Flavobacterium sp.]|uniref:NUDIX hydrolase n=1 Tax=Flavobacterium sp. TaxID=239 RepID=UPI003BD26A24